MPFIKYNLSLQEHIVICVYEEIPCGKCEVKVLKLELEEHLEKECIQRQVECDYCRKIMPFADLQVCCLLRLYIISWSVRLSIPCPSGIPPSDIIVCFPIISYHCSSTHRNSSLHHLLQDHNKKDCQSFPISCALCNETGIPRGKLKEHHDPENGDCEGSKAVCPFRQLGCKSIEVIKIFKELIRNTVD